MRRALAVVPLLLVALAPAAAGDEALCHGGRHELQTLTVALPASSPTVRPGTRLRVPVAVHRAAAPADAVAVHLVLRYGRTGQDVLVAAGQTDVQGRVTLPLTVPARARGPVTVTVYGSTRVVNLPCYGEVTEIGETSAQWGRVAR